MRDADLAFNYQRLQTEIGFKRFKRLVTAGHSRRRVPLEVQDERSFACG